MPLRAPVAPAGWLEGVWEFATDVVVTITLLPRVGALVVAAVLEEDKGGVASLGGVGGISLDFGWRSAAASAPR